MDIPATGIALVDAALRLLVEHAYLITLLATVLENLPVIGSLTPGETIVLAAGFVASLSPNDAIVPVAVFIVAFIGSLAGSNVSYLIGRRGGRPALERYGHRVKLGERRIKDAEGYFERHGHRTILLGRFAPGIKNLAPLLAGVSHMDLLVFEFYTVVGAAVYAAAMVALGYFFGSNFSLLLKIVSRIGWGALALFVIVVGGGWLFERRRYIRRREAVDIAAAEAAEAEADHDGSE